MRSRVGVIRVNEFHRSERYYSDVIVRNGIESEFHLELLGQCDGG